MEPVAQHLPRPLSSIDPQASLRRVNATVRNGRFELGSDALERCGTPPDASHATLVAKTRASIREERDPHSEAWFERLHPAFREGLVAYRGGPVARTPEQLSQWLDLSDNGSLLEQVARRDAQMLDDFVRCAAEYGNGARIIAMPTPCKNPFTGATYLGAAYALVLPARRRSQKLYVHKIGTHENEWDIGRVKQAATLRMPEEQRGMDPDTTTQIFMSGPPTTLRVFQDALNAAGDGYSDTNRNNSLSESDLHDLAHPVLAPVARAFAGTYLATGDDGGLDRLRFYLDLAKALGGIALQEGTLKVAGLLANASGLGQSVEPDFIKFTDTQFNSDTRQQRALMAEYAPDADVIMFDDMHSGLSKDYMFIDVDPDDPRGKRAIGRIERAIGMQVGGAVSGYATTDPSNKQTYQAANIHNSSASMFAREDALPIPLTLEDGTGPSTLEVLRLALHSAHLRRRLRELDGRGQLQDATQLGAIHALYRDMFRSKKPLLEQIETAQRVQRDFVTPVLNGARASVG